MLREEEERIQEHMSILDDHTCAFDADDAAAKEANEIGANEIGAERVRVILSLSLSLPHTNTASATTVSARLRAGAAAAVVDECASIRPSMNVRPQLVRCISIRLSSMNIRPLSVCQ
jgi:hypothetical protein